MAIPSSTYAVDTTTTLANGTELKWTKQIKTIYPNVNDTLDRSCTYSEMASPVFNKSGYAFKQNLLTDQYAPSYGANIANTRWAKGFLRTDGWTKNVWYGTVLVDMIANSSNVRRYFFGYTDTSGSIVNTANGGNARILRDIKVNKLLFNVTIKGYKISDYNAIDYTADPFSAQAPSEVTIKLSELDAHPNDYIVTTIFYGNTLVYGPNGVQKWLGSSISPTFACFSSDVGGFHWIPFIEPSPNFSYSYQTQNGHPSWTGSAGGGVPFNLAYNYVFGCDNTSMNFELPDTFANIDASLQALALAQYGYDSNWNHQVFFNKKLHTFGDFRAIELIYGNVAHSGGNPGSTYTQSVQTSLMIGITGDAANKMIAGLGLYFCDGDEDFDPNDENIIPDTMYTSQHIWLGEMSAHGITTGRWVKGSDIENYTGPNKNGVINDADYTPGSGGGGGSDDDNDDAIATIGAPFASGLAHYYVTTAASPVLQQISEAMSTWDIDATKKDLYRNLISCKLIKPPAPVPSASGVFTIYGVKPQYQGSDITITEVTGNPTASFGPYTISRKFGDFRDYSPYTKVEIFLPYCGWCGLPSHVVGKDVTVQYFTDIIAATCKAIVFCGNNIVAEASGVIGLDIPFASENVGAKMTAANAGLLASTKGALQTALGVGTMVSTKGQKGVNSVMSGLSAYVSGFTQMSMAANENWTEISGKTGDGCNIAGTTNIIIKITRPKYGANSTAPYVPAKYGNSVGFVSMKTVTVSSVTGLLISDNVDTSGISGATERERSMIKSYLESGIIVEHPEP